MILLKTGLPVILLKTSASGDSSRNRRFWLLGNPRRRFFLDLSQRTDIARHGAFGTCVHAIAHTLGRMKRSSAHIAESGEVREHIRGAIVRNDEPATF